MAAYRFNRAERYAVFTVHREVCWLCRNPVSLGEMQVDHIVPEHLENTPELDEAKRLLGLPASFRINGFENWKPAHSACNRNKGGHIFSPSPLIQKELEHAASKVDEAIRLRDAYLSDRRIDLAFQTVLMATKEARLSPDQLTELKEAAALHEANRAPEDRGKPFEVAPWLKILSEGTYGYVMQGPTGLIGGRPRGEHVDSSFDCPRCGPTGWNGARCIVCGMLNDE